MASQTGATRSKGSLAEVDVRKNDNQLTDRANDAVTRRAYSLFLAAGGEDGQDLTHWLQAESEVLRRIPEIREAASWYTVNVPLPGFAPEEIHVNVDDARALVAAEKADSGDGRPGDGMCTAESVYLVANWPTAVDPATASAYLKNESLILTAKRTDAAFGEGITFFPGT
jgi:HSP20 family molecular chaperone IbpA